MADQQRDAVLDTIVRADDEWRHLLSLADAATRDADARAAAAEESRDAAMRVAGNWKQKAVALAEHLDQARRERDGLREGVAKIAPALRAWANEMREPLGKMAICDLAYRLAALAGPPPGEGG